MGLFDMGKATSDPGVAAKKLEDMAVNMLKEKSGMVRAEDAVALLSVVVAERCIDLDGRYLLRDHDMTPGSRVFSDSLSEILFGESPVSVYNGMKKQLIGSGYTEQDFPPAAELVEHFAANIGKGEEWGNIPTTIPQQHRPGFLPLKAGFETRKAVDKHLEGLAGKRIALQVCVNALCGILKRVSNVLEPKIGLRLSLELVNGMSKTAPMTERAMRQAGY